MPAMEPVSDPIVRSAWFPVLRSDHLPGESVRSVTIAGEELVEKLCGIPALNLIDPATQPRLRELLKKALSTKLGSS